MGGPRRTTEIGSVGDHSPAASRASSARRVVPALVQPKLRVGAVDDPLEREADEIADRVMRTPGVEGPPPLAASPPASRRPITGGAAIRRCPGGCPTEDDAEAVVRRCPSGGPEDEIRRSRSEAGGSARPVDGGSAVADAVTETTVLTGRSGGTPFGGAARRDLEHRLGTDLSAVRLHTDRTAADAAVRIGARAFTVGTDIFFAGGEYRPQTASGRRLLAHELAHTMQQATGGSTTVRRAPTGDVGVRTAGLQHWLGGGTVQLRYRSADPIDGVPFPFMDLRHVFTGFAAVSLPPVAGRDGWAQYDIDMPGLAPLQRGNAVVAPPTRWTFWVRYTNDVASEAQAEPTTRAMIRHVTIAAQRGTATRDRVAEGLAGVIADPMSWDRGRYFREVMNNNGLDWTVIMNYGNWCGKGGTGPVMDSLDECCKRHDECYGRQGCSIFDSDRTPGCDQCDDDAVSCWLGAIVTDPERYGTPGDVRYPCYRCGATVPSVEDRERCAREC